MEIVVREIRAKSILSRSGIPGVDYCVNPYVGCTHACRYCYASFMKRFTAHTEPWGAFADAKVNAAEVLEKELRRARAGSVMLSSVTDPYQPLEERLGLTRRCLEALLRHRFPVDILTKSPLVLRDVDLLEGAAGVEVGITVTTDDEEIRTIFEPGAPPIRARLQALRELFARGVRTYAFIGPILPMNPDRLAEELRPCTSYVYIDRMNYPKKTVGLYRSRKLDDWLDPDFSQEVLEQLVRGFPPDRVILC